MFKVGVLIMFLIVLLGMNWDSRVKNVKNMKNSVGGMIVVNRWGWCF